MKTARIRPASLPRLLLVAAACWLVPAAASGAPYVRGSLIPELHLRNGTILHAVRIVAVGSSTVVARWDGGQGSIRLALLPDDLRSGLTPPPAYTPPPAAPAPETIDPALASVDLPTDIKLTNGFVMHRSAVTRWSTDSVLVSYEGGVVTVLFKNITPEQKAVFLAHRDEALSRQAQADASSTVAQSDAASDEQKAKDAAEAQARDEAEKKAEEIRNGVSFHYLVKGMTRDEVKEAFGKPVDDKADQYFYPSRGHDKYGNSADRTLTFKDGLLDSWHDQRDGEPDGAVDH